MGGLTSQLPCIMHKGTCMKEEGGGGVDPQRRPLNHVFPKGILLLLGIWREQEATRPAPFWF